MLGTNRVRGREHRHDGKLQVRDIFYTLQGEGPFAGHSCVFIRLSGCNQRCWFCDTEWDDDKDQYLSVGAIAEDVLDQFAGRMPRLVVITGGEPLRQDLSHLIPALEQLSPNCTTKIQIETAGTIWQDVLHRESVYLVVSPKTPKIDPKIHTFADAFKYVIRAGYTDPEDGLPVMVTQPGTKLTAQRLARPRVGLRPYLSPMDELRLDDTKRNEAEVVQLALKHGYIAGIQLHKVWELK